MSFVEVIAKKRDGKELTPGEVAWFVKGAASGSIPPVQLAAMLMAICIRGMTGDETAVLTREMAASGQMWNLGSDYPQLVDKHSTGGVGDTVSLLLAPLLVSVGVPVAMVAGRSLGHTQGTVDKLEAIPGFSCGNTRDWVLATVEKCGAAFAVQGERMAPADKTLYALRDVTATIPSFPLIVGSIMSKKLALGARQLVLDVKWGTGAFLKKREDAEKLAQMLVNVAKHSGVRVKALVTDMNQPLGPVLGTAAEVREVWRVLSSGDDSGRLPRLSLRLAEEAMTLLGWNREEARVRLLESLRSGAALKAWEKIVAAHGGRPDPSALPSPSKILTVEAPDDGWVEKIDGEALGWCAAEAGAGRITVGQQIDPAAFLEVHVKLGEQVSRGQPLATLGLGGARKLDEESLLRKVSSAFRIGEEPPADLPLVVKSFS